MWSLFGEAGDAWGGKAILSPLHFYWELKAAIQNCWMLDSTSPKDLLRLTDKIQACIYQTAEG